MKKMAFYIALLALLSSCSTIRMRYKANFSTDNQKKGSFLLEKSYDVGSLQTWCIITGIFYGGACWAYLVTPLESHEIKIDYDAKEKIRTLTGANTIDIQFSQTTRLSWDEIPPFHTINYDDASSTPTPSSQPGSPENTSGDVEEFLR